MPIRSIETNGRTVHIAIANDFTPSDLGFIADTLRQGAGCASVDVDFRRAREISPAGLMSLAGILAALGVSYGFSGLSSSNERVLEYLRPALTASNHQRAKPSRSE